MKVLFIVIGIIILITAIIALTRITVPFSKEEKRMGRPSLAEQRRVEICRALQSCVIRNGSYEMTSVKDIAQEAGMAAGMLHHYFESKDDILLVTAEMVLLELQNHLSDLLRIKDAAEREKMLEELLGDNEQNRFYIMLQAMALAMPAVNELLLGKQEEMRDILAERLEFRGSDPEKAKADADRMTFLLCSALTTPKGVQSAAARQMTADTLQELFPLG